VLKKHAFSCILTNENAKKFSRLRREPTPTEVFCGGGAPPKRTALRAARFGGARVGANFFRGRGVSVLGGGVFCRFNKTVLFNKTMIGNSSVEAI